MSALPACNNFTYSSKGSRSFKICNIMAYVLFHLVMTSFTSDKIFLPSRQLYSSSNSSAPSKPFKTRGISSAPCTPSATSTRFTSTSYSFSPPNSDTLLSSLNSSSSYASVFSYESNTSVEMPISSSSIPCSTPVISTSYEGGLSLSKLYCIILKAACLLADLPKCATIFLHLRRTTHYLSTSCNPFITPL